MYGVSSVAGRRGAVKHSFVLIFGMFDDQFCEEVEPFSFLVVKKLLSSCVSSVKCQVVTIFVEVRVYLQQ